jgi:mannose-6-phosphate isomerase-like protein (cupin superfamily)
MLKEAYAQTIGGAFQRTTYGQWLKSENVRIYEDWAVPDVWDLELAPWPRMGVRASFITLYPMMEGQRGMFVAEIPPGGATEPIRHLYEQVVMVLEGRGTTEIWQEGDSRKHVFEWGRGSIFSPPLNVWYRMYNLGRDPVKLVAINRAPAAMNEFHSAEFIFTCTHVFRERFSGEEGFFTPALRNHRNATGAWETNFIPNALENDLDPNETKVSAGGSMAFRLCGNSMTGHISQWPVGRYHKAHFHGAGAMLLGLRSRGYVLLWPAAAGTHPYTDGHEDDVIEVPWGRGSVYSPPSEWYHQHFNTGPEPARHLAIRGGNPFSGALLGSEAAGGPHATTRGQDEGGTVLDYESEDPEVRRRFQEALKREGVANEMPAELYEPGFVARTRAGFRAQREAAWGKG